MHYEDFKVVITEISSERYAVAVTYSPAGEAYNTTTFPFLEELQGLLPQLWKLSSSAKVTFEHEESSCRRHFELMGQKLFESLMVEEVLSCYDLSRYKVARQGKGLRIRLTLQSARIAALPWELMFDSRCGDFIALSRYISIVRHIDLQNHDSIETEKLPLRILFACVSSNDVCEEEGKASDYTLRSMFAELEERGVVHVEWIIGGTWREIYRVLSENSWHIFHFIGYGSLDEDHWQGLVWLTNAFNKACAFSSAQLARLLADHQSLLLVILGVCKGGHNNSEQIFSSAAAALVCQGVPSVVSMQSDVTYKGVMKFACLFYESLLAGQPFDTAIAEARIALSLEEIDSFEWTSPVVYVRSTARKMLSSLLPGK